MNELEALARVGVLHFKGKREKENFEHALKSRFLGFT